MRRLGAVVALCILGAMILSAIPGWTCSTAECRDLVGAEGSSVAWVTADAGGMVLNPHSDLIFRATGATTCLDCHRAGKEGALSPQAQDNALVRELKAKAKGIHGPGRFADCLRCHAGGNKGVEKYGRESDTPHSLLGRRLTGNPDSRVYNSTALAWRHGHDRVQIHLHNLRRLLD
jgi:hypothetical protein